MINVNELRLCDLEKLSCVSFHIEGRPGQGIILRGSN